MARDHAKVNLAIWGDPDFRVLPPPAQHLYLMLWTSPGLSYAGVHDWRPARLTGRAGGWTVENVQAAADSLAARHFLVVDDQTEEVLIRSWIRWDGILKMPRMAISCINAYSDTESPTLRQVIVHQLEAERERMPDLSCWADQRVQDVLSHPSVSAKDLPTPEDPFRDGFTHGFTPGSEETQSDGCPPVYTPPTTATATATSLRAVPAADATDDATPKSSRRKPERPLPETWKPNARHHELAIEKRVDITNQVTRFRNHAQTHDRRARDWDAAFRTWLDKSDPDPKQNARRDVGVDQWLA